MHGEKGVSDGKCKSFHELILAELLYIEKRRREAMWTVLDVKMSDIITTGPSLELHNDSNN